MWYKHKHTHNGILLSYKECSSAVCSNVDGPRDYHTKWSKSDRERQILYDITYIWNLKNNTSECIQQNRNRPTDIENKLVITRWDREHGRDKLGVWD